MKKKVVILVLLIGFIASAQDKFTEGVIISKRTVSSDNEQLREGLEAMELIETTTYFKGNKSRSELSNSMSGSVITIADNDTKETLVLMDNPMLGKEYVLQKEINVQEAFKEVKIVAGDKTKTILGYVCKQYFVKMDKDGAKMEMEMYMTEAILAKTQQIAMLGGKLKGFPLYIEVSMDQMGSKVLITMEVTEIKKEKISDDKFSMVPPEGYKKR